MPLTELKLRCLGLLLPVVTIMVMDATLLRTVSIGMRDLGSYQLINEVLILFSAKGKRESFASAGISFCV